MSENGRRRLTSWKEIASHLGRDVRTVLRWEKERGLPVRRVPGATGRVVFAYSDELDAWSRGELPPPAPRPVPPETQTGSVAPAARVAALRAPRWAVLSVGMIAIVSIAAWRTYASRALLEVPAAVRVTNESLFALDPGGATRWRYDFAKGEHVDLTRYQTNPSVDIVDDGDPGLLAGNSLHFDPALGAFNSGHLLWFRPDGVLRRSITFTDVPRFGKETFAAIWALTDFRVDESSGARRVIASAHHYQWWPSIVTAFDHQWAREGTFVHAGWVERLQWISPDRLLIAGYSNAYDGGFVALLDPKNMDGQGPVPAGSKYECTSCGRARPIRYVVMPRSEVNIAGSMPFNRAVVDSSTARIVARTVEAWYADGQKPPADALYEFTPSLDLVRASYSDRYSDEHRALEAAGRIKHTVAQCPDRDGPRRILVWEPAAGWRTIEIKH